MTSDSISPKGSGGRGSGGLGGVKAGPVGVSTSREAVERDLMTLGNSVGLSIAEWSPVCNRIFALLTERDALQARAERAEAGLRYYRDQMCEGFCTDLKSQSEYGESMDFDCAGCKARATLAQLDAEPAGRARTSPDLMAGGSNCIICGRGADQHVTAEKIDGTLVRHCLKMSRDEPREHWGVDVRADGETILTIETEFLSGRELSERDEEIVRTAAHHLLSFIGEPPQPAGFVATGAEDRWYEDMENACPHCGGSGHKGDVSEPAGVRVDREAVARALWKVNCCDSTYDEAVKASEKGVGVDASAVLFIHELADAAIATLEPGQTRVKVPTGQTPLNDDLGHRYLDVIKGGEAARDSGAVSPYHGHSLEHCLHATGWVQRDLKLALDNAKRKGWEQAKEAAAELAQSMHGFTLDREGNATGVRAACPEEISEAIRAMPYPGDS